MSRTLHALLAAAGLIGLGAGAAYLFGAGRGPDAPEPAADGPRVVAVIGGPGGQPGRFRFPRALAVDAAGRLYVGDKSGRIQRFSADGRWQTSWTLPGVAQDAAARGTPTGLYADADGTLYVPDTHAQCVRVADEGGWRAVWGGGQGARGKGQGEGTASGFGLRAKPAPGSSPGQALSEVEGDQASTPPTLKPEAWSLKPEGAPQSALRTHVGPPPAPGASPFGAVTDLAPLPAAWRHARGEYWVVTEYGDDDRDRLLVLDAEGAVRRSIGRFGTAPGRFRRPMGVAVDAAGVIYVADAVNHRLQVLTAAGEPRAVFGEPGAAPGRLRFPYDVALDARGNVYVAEFGNHRVSRFTTAGRFVDWAGGPGDGPAQLAEPWGVAVAPDDTVYVADTGHHRVVRFRFPAR